jgi:hypothetical protein
VLAISIAAATASAQEPPPITVPVLGHFRSVLAQGGGQQLSALEFAQYEATGRPRRASRRSRPYWKLPSKRQWRGRVS